MHRNAFRVIKVRKNASTIYNLQYFIIYWSGLLEWPITLSSFIKRQQAHPFWKHVPDTLCPQIEHKQFSSCFSVPVMVLAVRFLSLAFAYNQYVNTETPATISIKLNSTDLNVKNTTPMIIKAIPRKRIHLSGPELFPLLLAYLLFSGFGSMAILLSSELVLSPLLLSLLLLVNFL